MKKVIVFLFVVLCVALATAGVDREIKLPEGYIDQILLEIEDIELEAPIIVPVQEPAPIAKGRPSRNSDNGFMERYRKDLAKMDAERQERESLQRLVNFGDDFQHDQASEEFQQFLADLLLDKYSKERDTLTYKSGVSLKIVIIQQRDVIHVVFPPNGIVSFEEPELTQKDFDKCEAFLQKEYASRNLALGDNRTIRIHASFSRYPEMQVTFGH
tara:strand:- start:621 stop:1262 length:642 start_codon:yes stop_codon:yes gene_type:complete